MVEKSTMRWLCACCCCCQWFSYYSFLNNYVRGCQICIDGIKPLDLNSFWCNYLYFMENHICCLYVLLLWIWLYVLCSLHLYLHWTLQWSLQKISWRRNMDKCILAVGISEGFGNWRYYPWKAQRDIREMMIDLQKYHYQFISTFVSTPLEQHSALLDYIFHNHSKNHVSSHYNCILYYLPLCASPISLTMQYSIH